MKIKIKIETESGADLRKGLMGILYDLNGEDLPENAPTSEVAPQTQATAPAPAPRKRPTKAELDAKKAEEQAPAAETTATQPASTEQAPAAETTATTTQPAQAEAAPTPETTAATTTAPPAETAAPAAATGVNEITKAFLTPIVIQKGREGKRDKVVEILTSFGAVNAKGEAGLPHLDPAKYEEFHKQLILI